MTELAYAERTTNWTTTNTSVFDTGTSAKISSLDVTVVGTGAAVEVEFFAPAVGNGSGLVMTSWFVVNVPGDKYALQYRRWVSSSGGVGGSMKARVVLTNGVSYKFEVGLSATGASTTTVYGNQTGTAAAMFLRVTG